MFSRFYKIDLSPYCLEDCNYCSFIGNKPETAKSIDDIERSLEKALSGHYQGVVLPCNVFYQKNYPEIFDLLLSGPLPIEIELHSRYLSRRWAAELEFIQSKNITVRLLVDQFSNQLQGQLSLLKGMNIEFKVEILIQRSHEIFKSIDLLTESILEKTEFRAPIFEGSSDEILSTTEIKEILSDPRFASLRLKKPWVGGADPYDYRIDSKSDLEPVLGPCWESSGTEVKDVKVSVVIPVFNNQEYLSNVLMHLSNQSLSSKNYEVIVVDDGSTPFAKKYLKENIESELSAVNFKYIYFPREKQRFRGSGGFRAGIARNLGVKNSSGKYLCFLDSDILVPPHFLERLLSELEQYDVVQGKRLFLNQSESSDKATYAELSKINNFAPEGNYWKQFYIEAKNWNQLKYPWKYICTYCLSMSRENFVKSGWFKKNFHFYGFEDTELGYRLHKMGLKFKLLDLDLYHLFHTKDKSEYKNSTLARRAVLSKTAKIFFFNHLELEIYRALPGLVSSRTSFSYWKNRLKRIFKKQAWEK